VVVIKPTHRDRRGCTCGRQHRMIRQVPGVPDRAYNRYPRRGASLNRLRKRIVEIIPLFVAAGRDVYYSDLKSFAILEHPLQRSPDIVVGDAASPSKLYKHDIGV